MTRIAAIHDRRTKNVTGTDGAATRLDSIWMAIVTALLLLLSSSGASAATFQVTKTTDDAGACDPSDCSLREAVLAANGLPGLDVIELPAGVHELTLEDPADSVGLAGDLNTLEPVEIHGSVVGRTVIDGNGIDRIFELFPLVLEGATYVLSDLTLRGGSRESFGGAVYASGTNLVIRRCVFEENHGSDGGAVYLVNVETFIDSSTFRNNSASGGGGALLRLTQLAEQALVVENSTFSGNTAGFVGGALLSQGDDVLNLRNVTVARNVAPFGSALFLDRISSEGLVFESSIIEGDCAFANSNFPPTSLGGNLQGPGDSCFLTHPTDQSNVADLGLRPLEPSGNGYTHSLLPGSPAVDAADSCPERDQRGAPRPQDGDGDGVATCDAGAYELGTPDGLADVPALAPWGLSGLAALLAVAARGRLRLRNVAAVLILAAIAPEAWPAVFKVDQLTDDDGACTPGACSLREAALAANALPGVDTLQLAPGIHELTIEGINETQGFTGDVNFREPVIIEGAGIGSTVVDGNGIDGILSFSPFELGQERFFLRDLTLRGGSRANYRGGALHGSGGYLTIERCSFEENYAIRGGAISLGNMETVIRSSTFIGNRAGSAGGAIYRTSYGIPLGLLIETSTISGNSASYAGAVFSGGEGVFTLRSSTVADNSTLFAPSALLLENVAPIELVVESSILEGSCDWPGSTFPPTSLGGNLQSPGGYCYLNHPSDQAVTDFGLGPLTPSSNGAIRPLLPGSPAVDAADSCPERDQHGAPRPQDGDGDGVATCDAGAYELGTPDGLADVPALAPWGLFTLATFLAVAALALRPCVAKPY